MSPITSHVARISQHIASGGRVQFELPLSPPRTIRAVSAEGARYRFEFDDGGVEVCGLMEFDPRGWGLRYLPRVDATKRAMAWAFPAAA